MGSLILSVLASSSYIQYFLGDSIGDRNAKDWNSFVIDIVFESDARGRNHTFLKYHLIIVS